MNCWEVFRRKTKTWKITIAGLHIRVAVGSIGQKFVAVTSSQVSTSFTATKKINYVIFFSSPPPLSYERVRERPIVFKGYSTYLPTTCMNLPCGSSISLPGRFRAESTAEAAGSASFLVSGLPAAAPAIPITISAPPPSFFAHNGSHLRNAGRANGQG